LSCRPPSNPNASLAKSLRFNGDVTFLVILMISNILFPRHENAACRREAVYKFLLGGRSLVNMSRWSSRLLNFPLRFD
jgi:hypothetical protein